MDIKKYSTSPNKHSFYRNHWNDQLYKRLVSKELYDEMMDLLNTASTQELLKDKNFDLEYDLRSNQRILDKARNSEVYCQELYASLCNNQFFYGDKEWTCTWRTAGGIVADILQKGDYIDWYSSGNEGFVTEEIKLDLLMMGWTIRDHDEYMNECKHRAKDNEH